ncbi:hypothetical protein J8I29_28505 [Labrys sp. LIt4]|uniref:hypothetical protein n=1 Tax=Labrys sp. LIt4 TaxID=2821355 RepID=UPI001AE0B437|nr:hypothetical protein [Labrys sp. LIt4]MBP0583301.1 hypothetical protein [Labrys sp. LIt4]
MTPQERISFLNAGESQKHSQDRTRIFLLTMSSALPRALMKDGNLQAFLKAAESSPSFAASRATSEKILGLAGASLSELQKSPTAQQLDQAGYVNAAATILASKVDIGEWIAYRKSHPAEDVDPADLLMTFILDHGPSLRHGGMRGLEKALKVPPDDRPLDNLLASRQLQRLAPLGSWLQYVRGREALSAPYSELLGEIDAEKLDARSVDDLAVALVTKLDRDWGRSVREQILAKYPVPMRLLTLSGNEFPAKLFFDTVFARKALAPLLADPSASTPAKPELISRDFAWSSWVEVAQSLQAGKKRSDQPYVTVELLQAAGRNSEAAETLSAVVPRTSEESERIGAYATKMLVELLRRCDDEMNPNDAFPVPLYRFGEP